MRELLSSSVYFGVFISLGAYLLGQALRRRTGLAIFNPLLVAVVLVMGALALLGVDYADYQRGASLIGVLLTPATICLAVPLYEQLSLLRRHPAAILCGIGAGVLASLLCVLGLSVLFGLDHQAYVTLLPKSITTAIGMGVSEELGEIEGAMSSLSIVVAGMLTVAGASLFAGLL